MGICPTGWQVTTLESVGILTTDASTRCGGDIDACLKIGGLTGFNLPYAGNRGALGSYFNASGRGLLWATDSPTRYLGIDSGGSYWIGTDATADTAFSVRCLRNGWK